MRKSHGLWLFLLAMPALATDTIPAPVIDKVRDTPDLMQSLPAAGLPDGGVAHCGPVAVSNSLVWLARHGYPRLAPAADLTPVNQGALARLLGERSYMHTTYQDGTSVDGVLYGVARYLTDHAQRFEYLGYQGWDTSSSPYDTGIKVPDLAWIKSGLRGKSAVWLKIGWYRQTAPSEWQKFAGHWVTLVGHGVDERGHAAADMLIVHDPAPRSGERLSSDYVQVIPLEAGTLRSSSGSRSIATTGFFRLAGGLKIKDGADFGALDAAVVLKLQ